MPDDKSDDKDPRGVLRPGVVQPRVVQPRVVQPRVERATVSTILTPDVRVTPVQPLRPGGPFTRVDLDPIIGQLDRSEPAPLLLLPLRLEYRIFQQQSRPQLADVSASLTALADVERRIPGTEPAARKQLLQASSAVKAALLATPVRVASPVLTRTEIWFRWYPDDGFARKGVAPPTELERSALVQFRSRLGARAAFDPSDATTAAAWADLAAQVGAQRALHLLRQSGSEPAENPAATHGAIAALPRAVALYSLKGTALELLATGSAIPANGAESVSPIAYTPEALDPGGWLREFPVAERHGMAVKVSDPAAVQRALGADAIIAVGRSAANGVAELTSLVRDGISNGTFAVLRQDTPTNNSPTTRTVATEPDADLHAFLAQAAMDERGEVPTDGSAAASVLAEALGLDGALLRKAIQAGDTPFADARAMLRVIGPALLDGSLDGVTAVSGVDENEFVDILAAAFCARGPLPAVRFGQNPYGILPMTQIAALSTEDPDPKVAGVHGFLAGYARIVRALLPARAEQEVTVLQPNDPSAAAKLEELFKNQRVSTRLVVGSETDSSTAPLGCPIVTGKAPEHLPTTYLANLANLPLALLSDPTSADTATPLLYRLARLSLSVNLLNVIVKDVTLTPIAVPPSAVPPSAVPPSAAAPPAAVRRRPSDLQTEPVVRNKLSDVGLERLTVKQLATANETRLSKAAITLLRKLNKDFAAALAHLLKIAQRPQGSAELEMLLFEVVDLLQHRSDVWATGLAYARLSKLRKGGLAGLNAGYYGFIGKLRPASATGASNGYIQAPSMAQATTAAVLRSAYTRQAGAGAFEIDLSSARARRALGLLDILRKGIVIEEALGLRGERWLHEQKLSRLTLDLRRRFPLTNAVPPEASDGASGAGDSGIRVFDGVAFSNDTLSALPSADRASLQKLQAVLQEELDALSDLILAEAAHQRAMGRAEAAKGWLNVLSGGSIPGVPEFIRTQRSSQGSSHRLSVVLPRATPQLTATPRELAEPALAALATAYLPAFSAARVRVTIERLDDAAKRHAVDVGLQSELGLSALDLVIGGQSECEVRLRQHVLGAWLREPAFSSALGAIPPRGLAAFVNATARISIESSPGAPSFSDLLARAQGLRGLVQNARMLEPADLNAAASPSAPLDEVTEVGLVWGGVQALRERVTALKVALDAAIAGLRSARLGFLQPVRQIRVALDANPGRAPDGGAIVQAETGRRTLEAARVRISAFSEPAALRGFTIEEAIADPETLEESLLGIETRASKKSATLAAALLASAGAAPAGLEAARGLRRQLTAALAGTLDGDALPILVPIAKVKETTPLTDTPLAIDAALGPWRSVRQLVARSADIAKGLASFRAVPVSAAATAAAPSENTDPRDETESPLTSHFGVLLADPATLSAPALAGFVSDEWTEERPARTQSAGLAVGYDSPQAEAPQCLLLGVKPGPATGAWTDESAANLVVETIAWMKVRAMSTDQKPWPASFLPHSNQVPTKDGTTRIPIRRFRGLASNIAVLDGTFVSKLALDAGQVFGAAKAELNERAGFYGIRE